MKWLLPFVLVAILAARQPARPHHTSFSAQEADSHQEVSLESLDDASSSEDDGSQLLVTTTTEKGDPPRPTGSVRSEQDLEQFSPAAIMYWCNNSRFAPEIFRSEQKKYCTTTPKRYQAEKEETVPRSAHGVKVPAPCPSRLVRGDKYRVVKRYRANVSAYNSERKQTDDSPMITASGASVYCGVVASNALAPGSIVRLPELYGKDTLFFVEDRMKCLDGSTRCSTDPRDARLDIWFPKVPDAKEFGRRQTMAEVVEPKEG